jgi:hypothetical protein
MTDLTKEQQLAVGALKLALELLERGELLEFFLHLAPETNDRLYGYLKTPQRTIHYSGLKS